MDEQQRAALERQNQMKRGAAIIDGTQDGFREDGYSNLLTKYGTAQDSSTAYQWNGECFVDDMKLIQLYEGNGLFAKIIDRPAEEAVKHGLDIDYGDDDIAEYVEDRMDDLGYEDKFATAEKWARLYGGAIIVMLVDDGCGLEEPLDWRNVRSIEELRVFERAIVQPDYTQLYGSHFFDSMETDMVYGEPEYYQVSSTYGYFAVHRTRCLVFRNGRLPEQTSNANYRYWGIPEYVRIRRALRECITSHEDGVKLLERSAQAIYKMKNLANMLSTADGEDKVLQRLQVIDMARSILNSIAIDNDGEDYDFKTLQMAGVKDVLDATCNMLSAVTDIPQTVLFGRSPAGENSTGESDMENYYNMVENLQKQNMKQNTRTVIDLVLKQGQLEGKIREIPKYKVKFTALWSLSDAEQATVDKTKADTVYVKAQTAQLLMDSSVIDPSEVRNRLAKEGDLNIEEILTEQADGSRGSGDSLNLPDDTFSIIEPVEKETIGIIGTEEGKGDEDNVISITTPDGWESGETIRVKCTEEPAVESGRKIRVILPKENADGGPGSGNFNHGGRPGQIGGSSSGNNSAMSRIQKRVSRMSDEEKGDFAESYLDCSYSKEVKPALKEGKIDELISSRMQEIEDKRKSLVSEASITREQKKAISEQAKEIANRETERIVAIDKKGNILYEQDGDAESTSTRITGIENATIHNHPGNKKTFSNGDVDAFVAKQNTMSSMSVIASGKCYTISKTSKCTEDGLRLFASRYANETLRNGNGENAEEWLYFNAYKFGVAFSDSEDFNFDGGAGSGDWGHSGRPGKVGGSGGKGANGTGTNAAANESTAKSFAGENGAVIKMKLASDAKVISDDDLIPLVQQSRASTAGLGDSLSDNITAELMTDPGTIAASMGYDAIYDSTMDWYNVMNRSKVIVCEEETNHDSADYHAAAVVVIHDGRILCGRRTDDGTICGPGGHVEDGETVEDAAVRETMEEFKIIPLNILPLGDYEGSPGLYLNSKVYFTDEFYGTPEADGKEMQEARWLSAAELKKEKLYPPFEAGLDLLKSLMKNYLTSDVNNSTIIVKINNTDGGPGSGNFNHGGRPGKIGGSAGGSGTKHLSSKDRQRYEKALVGKTTGDGIKITGISKHADQRLAERRIGTTRLIETVAQKGIDGKTYRNEAIRP